MAKAQVRQMNGHVVLPLMAAPRPISTGIPTDFDEPETTDVTRGIDRALQKLNEPGTQLDKITQTIRVQRDKLKR